MVGVIIVTRVLPGLTEFGMPGRGSVRAGSRQGTETGSLSPPPPGNFLGQDAEQPGPERTGGIEAGDVFHKYSGWLMLPISFLILLAVIGALKWAMVPVMRYTLAS